MGTEVFAGLVRTLRMILSGTATSIPITLPRWAMAGGSRATVRTSTPITEIPSSPFGMIPVVHGRALVSSKTKATPASHRVRLIGAVADRPLVVERAGGHLAHRRPVLAVVVAVCLRAATHAAAVTTVVAAVAEDVQPSHDVNIPTPYTSR